MNSSISKRKQKARDFRKSAPNRTADFRREPRHPARLTGDEVVAALVDEDNPSSVLPDGLRHNPDLHALIASHVKIEPELLGDPALEALKLLVKRQGIGPARRKMMVTPTFVDRTMKNLINFLIHGKNDDILLPPLRHLGKHLLTLRAYDRRTLSHEGRMIWVALKAINEELKDDDSESVQSYDSDD